LHAWLTDIGLPFALIGLEAGQCSFWLHAGLAKLGQPVVCIETRHASAVIQAQNIKTDRNDARGIAQMVRTAWFRAVHVKGERSQKIRALMSSRRCLLDKRLDLENHIRATLRGFGLKIGVAGLAAFALRVRELIADDADLQLCIEPLLDARSKLHEQFRVLTNMLMRLVRKDEICRRFMTVPGVGALTASRFYLSVATAAVRIVMDDAGLRVAPKLGAP
jgi:transposase